jgi:hypothetical protein
MSGDGISLVNTREISLARMVVDNNDGSGIYGDDVTNFTITDSTVTGNADTATGTEAGLRFQELLGDCAITNTEVSGSFEDNVRITPASGALTSLTISGSTIGPNSATTGGNGVALVGAGAALASVTVTGSTFQGNRGAGFLSNYAGTGGHTVVVSGNVFRDNGRAVSLAANGTAGLNLGVTSNLEIVRSAGNAIELMSSADTAAVPSHGQRHRERGQRPHAQGRGRVRHRGRPRGDERTIVAGRQRRRHTDLGALRDRRRLRCDPGPERRRRHGRDNTVRDVDGGLPCGSREDARGLRRHPGLPGPQQHVGAGRPPARPATSACGTIPARYSSSG